uniref:F-box domain-containing protein n=1 Tax=Oryza meridionalis TaxID=40149 RepID=A0A0E0CWW3_9ORYZ
MQSNSIQSYDQGRFNTLPDDILLSILERVDMRTVLRTSVLSTRWKHLPLLLSDVDLDVDEFIHQNSSMSAHEAMAVLIKLMSSLFGSPQNESIIKKLNLSFYLLTDLETSLKFLFNIGELVCNAIDSGKVKSVELTITTEKRRFKLTDLMSGASNIWIEYEGKELRTALNKITKLLLHGIYVKFNLLWTLVLLESAPSVKIFGVKVWNHSCDQDTVDREIFSERRNDLWDVAQLDSSVHYNQLEKLNFGGFNPTIKEHLDLVRTVIERAPKLKSVFLEDREPCKGCEAMDNPIYPSTISMFPQNEDEKSTVAKQLKAGTSRPLDMPNSKLRFVELNSCYVKTVEFLCLPKLEQLYCDSWRLSGAPLSFGVVPCLEELRLVCATSRIQSGFKLTDLLHGTANVQDIALDFQGEVVWNHACDEGTENRKQLSERRNDLWDAAQLDGSIHYLQLERLEFGGFNQIIREHLDFIRAVIERAPNLKSVILEDRDPCEDCEAMDNPIYPSISMFPQNNDEKSTIVKQLKAGMNRPVEIIFC